MSRNLVRALLTVGLLSAVAEPAAAASYTWTATNGGSFQTSGDWSPSGVPGTADSVLLNANATYTVTFSASATNTVFTQQQGTVTLAIGAGQAYQLAGTNNFFTVGNVNGQTANLTVMSDSLIPGKGTFANTSTGGIGMVSGSTGNLTITGAGSAFNCDGPVDVGVAGTGTLTIQNNATASVPGTPYIGSASGSNGTVTVSAGGTLSASQAIVAGYSGTGTLSINGGGSATVAAFNAGQNSGSTGTVNVGDGTTAASLTVTGGYLVNIGVGISGNGSLNVNGGGTLTGAGNVSFANAAGSSGTGTISGSWNETSGSMYIGGATNLAPGGTGSLTVNNGGTITLSGSGAQIYIVPGHGMLTVNAGGSVTTPNLNNYGTVNLKGAAIITESMNGSGLVNGGAINVSAGPADVFGPVNNVGGGQIINSSGGLLTFHDAFAHTGTEVRTTAGGRTVFLATVSGTGPYTGPGTVEYDGIVNQATGPALVTYAGDLALKSTTALDFVLGGTTAGSQYDQFAVTGTATLAGTLKILLINGFAPQPGQQFNVLTYGTHTGDFGTFTGLDLGNGYMLTPTAGPNAYSLVVTPVPEPGGLAWLAAAAFLFQCRRRHSGEPGA